MRQPYNTDLTDAQWALIEPLIPPAKSQHGRGRQRTVNLREVINAILYLNRTGCSWQLLPHDFPPPKTVYQYYRRWTRTALWDRLQ